MGCPSPRPTSSPPPTGSAAAPGIRSIRRGYLHHELINRGFWRCSAITGVLWGGWHVPLTLQGYGYPHHPVAGTLIFLVYALLFAPVFTFLRLRAGSVIAPAILHGTADGTVLLTLALVRHGDDRLTGWGTLSSLVVLAVTNVLIARAMAIAAKRRSGREPGEEDRRFTPAAGTS